MVLAITLVPLAGCGAAGSPAGSSTDVPGGVPVTSPSTAGSGAATEPVRTSGTPTLSALPDPDADVDALRTELDELTAYDAAADVVVTPTGTLTTARGVRVTGLAIETPESTIPAWLVEPPVAVPAPYAGVVYLHGSETDRDDLRDEAEALATAGAVSLVISAPFARPSSTACRCLQSYDDPALEQGMNAQTVIDIRRSLDLLAARPDVDSARLGIVGHSWGAWIAVDAAAVDDRVAAVAVVSSRPSWAGFLAAGLEPWAVTKRRLAGDEVFTAYLTAMAPFDALPQIGRLPGEALLLQFGERDDVVPPDIAQQLVDAAPTGTTTQWFPAGHALDDAATAARTGWITDGLGLPSVAPDVLADVGLPDE